MHCSRCGAALPSAPPSVCAACGYHVYVNARPTSGLIIVRDDRFLALLRAREPRAGLWELPGGFCDGVEHPADAAVREAREELGVDVVLGELVGMYLGTYDYQDETLPVLDCIYLASLPSGASITLDLEEAAAMTWLPIAAPPAMAFGTMDRALEDAQKLLVR
ncbi:ADP-ribose pyrophosphatase YjhB (NUDIX family) [Catenuloplanes nepalensis]|uniref:ADP-ribose pyrophosphatase YjhB (NUDIX family) n=1 Tax=Catenuloplanes nepalensis TaxID=587533 RepID=A0ABT9MJE1_9ACTN|nr:NUDIX hydrolase [Catenuloplanes nepalensis]MDP9791543.1 ADP-ribose pyrophosphatase YjhB (NUDIX family) [Catenuloplanes nepalensis]